MTTEASALVVEVPEADPVVRSWRERLDPAARAGMPAHVTLLFPFRPPTEIDEEALATALDVIGDEPPFVARFTSVATFPGRVAYLEPTPPEPFVRLATRLAAAFPDCPPYDGRYDTVIAHLTIGHAEDDAALAALVDDVAGELAMPGIDITTRVSAVALFSRGEDGHWTRRARIPLGTA